MNQLEEICAKLNQAGSSKETAQAREFVIQSLSSKWNGVRVCAAKAIARWGGRKNQIYLLKLLEGMEPTRTWTSEYFGFAKAFSMSIKDSDCNWILTLWKFNLISPRLLWGSLNNMRTEVLHDELRSNFQDCLGKDELELSLICRRKDWPDRTNRICQLANSSDASLARRAKNWISFATRIESRSAPAKKIPSANEQRKGKKVNRRSPILRPGKLHHR